MYTTVQSISDLHGIPTGNLPLGYTVHVMAGNTNHTWNGTEWVTVSLVMGDGEAVPIRPVINFMGRTISVGDNPDNNTTEVTVIDEVPAGGLTGQVLVKVSNTDYHITWGDPAVSGGATTRLDQVEARLLAAEKTIQKLKDVG